MTSQTATKNDKIMPWPDKSRRVTQDEIEAVRKNVQRIADRAREERINGRSHAWSALKK